jgi:hypothetical protein
VNNSHFVIWLALAANGWLIAFGLWLRVRHGGRRYARLSDRWDALRRALGTEETGETLAAAERLKASLAETKAARHDPSPTPADPPAPRGGCGIRGCPIATDHSHAADLRRRLAEDRRPR